MKEKYAKLLLDGLNLKNKKYLVIEIPSFLSEFKDILLKLSKDYNLDEVFVEETDPFKKHDLMKNLDQENINKHPMFDKSIYNKYAKLDAAFLFIISMIPNLMDDIDTKKISDTNKYVRSTQKYFRDLYESDKLNWMIAAVPNEYWANKGLNISLDELYDYIYDICLVKSDNPIDSWYKKLNILKDKANILNNYHFKCLHYTNKLGTDLFVYLPPKHKWCAGVGSHGEINNLPTEEIFTSPLYNKTEGIVYASKPLFYNNVLIEDFNMTFKDGKVCDFKAKKGEDLLRKIIENDEYSGYLGECALVSYDSPINNTNIIFKETLFDENASCHLALGIGFTECLNVDVDKDDLRSNGVNVADVHVDFMIGTEDLNIVGITDNDEEIKIMENGNLII